MHKRLLIVFILGFSSGLPLPLVSSTLQAWYAESGMSVMATGLLSLIGLPYVYRIIWGPFLDRYTLFALGKRRSWIITTQLLLLIGFNVMAWFLPPTAPQLMAWIGLLMACISATQDMAIEAHRTEYLPQQEHALGASFAVFGYRLALLVSGGLALILADYISWEWTYRLMGFLMLVGMFATLYSPEPSIPLIRKLNLLESFVGPVKELFQRREIVSLIFFIIFFKLGESFTTATSGIVMPFLIDGIGFSKATIGTISGIMGVFAIILGGLVAGICLLRFSLFNTLLVFGLIQAVCNILFVALAIAGKNVVLFAFAAILDNFAAGMGSTAIVALLMRLIDKRYTATQFSILAALSTLPRVFSGPFGAWLYSLLGWVGLYKLSVILALGFLPFLYKIRTLISNSQSVKKQQSLQEMEKTA